MIAVVKPKPRTDWNSIWRALCALPDVDLRIRQEPLEALLSGHIEVHKMER